MKNNPVDVIKSHHCEITLLSIDELKPYGYLTPYGYHGVTGFANFQGRDFSIWNTFSTEKEYLEYVKEYNKERGA